MFALALPGLELRSCVGYIARMWVVLLGVLLLGGLGRVGAFGCLWVQQLGLDLTIYQPLFNTTKSISPNLLLYVLQVKLEVHNCRSLASVLVPTLASSGGPTNNQKSI